MAPNETLVYPHKKCTCSLQGLPRWLIHDLLQPINAYRLIAEDFEHELCSSLPQNHSLLSSLCLMREAFQIEEHLLNSLRQYWRYATEPSPATHRSLSIEELVSAIEARHRTRFPSVPIELEYTKNLWAKSDPDQLLMLLSHLTDNAAQHARSGVSIFARNAGDSIQIDVMDDGEGLPAEIAGNLGMPFLRNPSARKIRHQGLGLGIFLAATIAERLEHILSVVSDGGSGCCFRVTLRSDGSPKFSKPQRGWTTALSGVSVLLMGCDESRMLVLARLISAWGGKTAFLQGAASAEAIFKDAPEIVLMDYAMWKSLHLCIAKHAETLAFTPFSVLVLGPNTEQQAHEGCCRNSPYPVTFVSSPPSATLLYSALLACLRPASKG